MNHSIAQVVVGLPVEGPFDYKIPSTLIRYVKKGQRVKVLFNRRLMVGYVIGLKAKSDFNRLNNVIACLDQDPVFDQQLMSEAQQFSQYYGCSLGEALETFIPRALRKSKNTNQQWPQTDIQDSDYRPTLLNGLHQLDQWEYIVGEAKKMIAAKKGVLILVPESSLLKKVGEFFKQHLGSKVYVLDRTTSQKNELEHWLEIKNGNQTCVIGLRSAVFSPIYNLGLIAICDIDQHSYKQDQTPHYHAHKVAEIRSQSRGIQFICTSVLADAEVWKKACDEKWEIKTEDIVDKTVIQGIDMENYNPRRSSIMSFPLQNTMLEALNSNKKILLYWNRRGFGISTRCQGCGHTLKCPRCDISLTFLFSKSEFFCRRCNFKCEKPKKCPECRGLYLKSFGKGIERIQSDVARDFPVADIAVVDKENSKIGKANIVIATQSIFKLGDTKLFDIVAILDFDSEFHFNNFRAETDALRFLIQMKHLTKEKLVIQTKMPDHQSIKALRSGGIEGFYKNDLRHRKDLDLPPFKHLLNILIRGEKEEVVLKQSEALYDKLIEKSSKSVEVLDPQVDMIPKLRDQYRYNIMLKCSKPKKMVELAHSTFKEVKKKGIVVTVNVDP